MRLFLLELLEKKRNWIVFKEKNNLFFLSLKNRCQWSAVKVYYAPKKEDPGKQACFTRLTVKDHLKLCPTLYSFLSQYRCRLGLAATCVFVRIRRQSLDIIKMLLWQWMKYVFISKICSRRKGEFGAQLLSILVLLEFVSVYFVLKT